MNDLQMDYIDNDAEVVYTNEELEAMYTEYVANVWKKNQFRLWCKEVLR